MLLYKRFQKGMYNSNSTVSFQCVYYGCDSVRAYAFACTCVCARVCMHVCACVVRELVGGVPYDTYFFIIIGFKCHRYEVKNYFDEIVSTK